MKTALLVGAGAAVGALARYSLTAALGGALLPLFIINVVGSALMGWFKPGPFWGTGVLGGFTSFAAFALLTSQLSPAAALGYTVGTVVGCVAAFLTADWARARQGARA